MPHLLFDSFTSFEEMQERRNEFGTTLCSLAVGQEEMNTFLWHCVGGVGANLWLEQTHVIAKTIGILWLARLASASSEVGAHRRDGGRESIHWNREKGRCWVCKLGTQATAGENPNVHWNREKQAVSKTDSSATCEWNLTLKILNESWERYLLHVRTLLLYSYCFIPKIAEF